MLLKQVKKMDVRERFVYWINERESIRQRREMFPESSPPWTNDKVLQTYRFTNVRRKDDRVSRWLLDEWYLPNKNHTNLPVACALARFINKPETLEQIGFPQKWDNSVKRRIMKIVRKIIQKGKTAYSGAYIINGQHGEDKIDCVVNAVNNVYKAVSNIDFSDYKNFVYYLRDNCFGVNYFMAGQITADLRLCQKGKWKHAKTWHPPGPGSGRGMNLFNGRDIAARFSLEQWEEELEELIEYCTEECYPGLGNTMEGVDWQNCLCEFSKYERALNNNYRGRKYR
jgi:hypothetical protein